MTCFYMRHTQNNSNVIRLTESQLRNVIKECVEQIIIESTHVLDERINNYIDMIYDHIEKYPNVTKFTIPFTENIYDNCNFINLTFQLIYDDDNDDAWFTNNPLRPSIKINLSKLYKVGYEGYRGSLRHEIRHYVDSRTGNGWKLFNGDLNKDDQDIFRLIYGVIYAINDGEINARYDELYEYLMLNKNQQNIDYKNLPFMLFDQLYDALDIIKNDSPSYSPSTVIGLSLYTKKNYNGKYKLNDKDYNDYVLKLDLNAYRAMKKSWINKIN